MLKRSVKNQEYTFFTAFTFCPEEAIEFNFLFSSCLKTFSCRDYKKKTKIFDAGGGKQIYRGFKVHDLITCESKVQVLVSLGS